MPSEQPLLTIAIPTYNRSGYLAQLLESLAPQLRDEPRIELIISDNASPDDTPDLIQRFIREGLQARYIRNPENIGPDRNFLQCFQQAAGRYVWLIGDDDVLLEGIISRVLRYLTGDDYDLVYLTPHGFREHARTCHIPDRHGIRESVFTDALVFAQRVGTMFTLITCNIVNKKRLGQISHRSFDEFIGTNFIQLGWTYPLLAHLRRALLVRDTYIAIRDGTSGGYSVARVFGSSLKTMTDSLLPDHPSLRNAIYRSAMRGILPLAILRVRQQTHGSFDKEDFHKYLEPIYGHSYEYWLWVYPIARAPLWAAFIWFHCIRRAVSMRAGLRYAYNLVIGKGTRA